MYNFFFSNIFGGEECKFFFLKLFVKEVRNIWIGLRH